jgi:succinate dehydrogenase / fumarate reductase membrane anchor subunit
MNHAIAAGGPVTSTSWRGAFFWLFQRLTGIFLAYFLITHVKVLHWDFNFTDAAIAPTGFLDFRFVIERLQGNLGWVIFYLFFIVSALYHGLNGLWAIVLDFRPSRGMQKTWLAVIWAVGILASIWGFYTLSSFYTFAPGGVA